MPNGGIDSSNDMHWLFGGVDCTCEPRAAEASAVDCITRDTVWHQHLLKACSIEARDHGLT